MALIMLQELVTTKIVFQISYYRMHMVCIVLRVIIFYNNGWSLYAVIMRFAFY